MKKQIAVLMAAATAVTTVAPAIANADVNTHDNTSISEVTEKVRKALNDTYSKENANGIEIPSGASVPEDFMNSKYIVLVKGVKDAGRSGFKKVNESDYKEFTNLSLDVDEDNNVDNSNADWFVVDDATKLSALLENNLDKIESEEVKVAIVDKGHDGDSSTRTTKFKHYVTDKDSPQTVSLTETAKKLYNLSRTKDDAEKATFVESVKINGETKIVDEKIRQGKLDSITNVTKIELELTEGKKYTLEVGDDAFDLKKGLDSKDSEYRLYSEDDELKPVVTQDVMDKIVNFKTIDNKDNKVVELDIKNGDTELYTISDVSKENLELNNIYTREDGYTKKGEDFVNSIINAKKEENGYKFNFGGVNYVLQTSSVDNILLNDAKIDRDGDGYKLTFDVKVKDANDEAIKKTLQFVIKGDKQRDLYDVLRDLKGTQEVVSGHFNKLAGSNRYATAIAVSEEQFGANDADSVVIVGGKAQLDGLAAAPLASAKNAPILLADEKDGLSSATLKEIDRACDNLNRKTVYIVGGEKSVPAKVVKQLEDKFNAVVIRVSGNDRMATSLEVARRLDYDGQVNNRLFLIGRDGAADAMSISSIAAKDKATLTIDEKKTEVKEKSEGTDSTPVLTDENVKKEEATKVKVSPILVVSKDGISRTTREFISKDLKGDSSSYLTYLIGGEKSLSTQVMKDSNLIDDNKTSRVSGINRYDTNVEVIKEFYGKDKIVANGAIFASGENAYLVDAQTSGAFAAYKDNRFPIVLAGNKLTKDQIDLMKDGGILDGLRSNIYQVGGVVSSDVMKVVVDKLDL